MRAGKIRYIGCFQLLGLAPDEVAGDLREVRPGRATSRTRPTIRSIGRDYEWELMPLGLDQKVGAVVWSPLGWGRLTGKIRRGQPLAEGQPSRTINAGQRPAGGGRVSLSRRRRARTGSRRRPARPCRRSPLNWLLQRPTVANVIVGARNEEQLRQNLGAVGWSLTPEQVAKLDTASATTLAYPYWHQRGFTERNPPPVS